MAAIHDTRRRKSATACVELARGDLHIEQRDHFTGRCCEHLTRGIHVRVHDAARTALPIGQGG